MSNSQYEIPEISLAGFQIVKGDMFLTTYTRQTITLSVWMKEISFSKAALNALNNCERIRIEVNAAEKKILVIPVTVQDKDNVRWATKSNDPKPRKIHCEKFTKLLYYTWQWDRSKAYKVKGNIVMSNQKVMLLFDFTKADSWVNAQGNNKNG